MFKVLVIDDDRAVLHVVSTGLDLPDTKFITAATADEGLKRIQSEPDIDAVLLDIVLPRMSGLELFQQIHKSDRRLPVVFMTAAAGSETAIEAMKNGAYDYVPKPLDLPKLQSVLWKALQNRRIMRVPVALSVDEEGSQSLGTADAFIGRSLPMLEVFKSIGQIAGQNVTVLVRGESGTGKELVARAVYQFSERANRQFLAVNCAALAETLLESELFGHEKGAFTGADRRRVGKFEQCNGGTLFLDEVGDLSPMVQGKVLRLLQDQRFERVGGNETIETDVRLIAATNRPLEEMVNEGTFRSDLFYRLNVVTIDLPPLRQREEDINLLLRHFLTRFRKELGKPEIEGISPEALELLVEYPWPGNIRELQSIVRQIVIKASGPVIVPDFLPAIIVEHEKRDYSQTAQPRSQIQILHETVVETADAPNDNLPADDVSDSPGSSESSAFETLDLHAFISRRIKEDSQDLYAETLEFVERHLLTRVLQATGGNQSQAAEILGITRGKVRNRISTFGISMEKTVSIDPS